MNPSLPALLALQDTDSAIALAQRQYQELDPGRAEKAAAETARVLAERLQRTWHETARDLQDAELELKTVEAKKKDYEDRLWSGKIKGSPKELEAAQHETEALGRQRSLLDDRILTLMDQAETRKAEAEQAAASQRQAEAALAARQADYQDKARKLAVRVEALSAKRAEQAAGIPPALLKRYDAMRAAKGGVAVARMERSGLCGVCHTSLPSNLQRSVTDTENIGTCENCGRMLCPEHGA